MISRDELLVQAKTFDECDLPILRIRILNQPCLTTVVNAVCKFHAARASS